MVGAPERIWAFQSDGGQRGWLHTQPPQAIIDIPTEYVRADLHAALTEERDRLKEIVDGTGLATAAIAAERDRLAKQVDELQELFRIDGENHASVIRDLTNRHETRITKYAERIKELRDANAELLAGLEPFAKVADQLHPGKYGPAWGFNKAIIEHEDFQKARALLTKHKATSTEGE